MARIKRIIEAVWQFCSYMFVRQRRPKEVMDCECHNIKQEINKDTMKILQISDIHWKKRKHWNDDFEGMKSRFLKDIKEYIEAGNEKTPSVAHTQSGLQQRIWKNPDS